MKNKIINCAVIGILVLMMNFLLSNSVYKKILPYYWGSKEIAGKRDFLTKYNHEFNTIFIGSSKTHNQIVPTLFDEQARQNKLDIRSFNFGVSGLLPMESLHIYRNLINKDSVKLKYAFIELNWIETIKYQNLNSVRSYYWLDERNYAFTIRSIFGSSMSLQRYLWGIFHYTVDFSENMLNVGKVNEYTKLNEDSSNLLKSDLNMTDKGFVPLYDTMNKSEEGEYKEVISSAESSVQYMDRLSNAKPSAAFLGVLQEIIAMSRSKGIRVYFVVPLQWKFYQYKEILPVINHLEGATILSMYDTKKYSEVYEKANFADPNHLNNRGAIRYTEMLFEAFIQYNNN